MGTQLDWDKYKDMLDRYGYTPEQIAEVEKIRTNYDHMTFEQFDFLFRQGIIKRTAKLRKPRNYYVNDKGAVLYLDHYWKSYQVAGYFKDQE